MALPPPLCCDTTRPGIVPAAPPASSRGGRRSKSRARISCADADSGLRARPRAPAAACFKPSSDAVKPSAPESSSGTAPSSLRWSPTSPTSPSVALAWLGGRRPAHTRDAVARQAAAMANAEGETHPRTVISVVLTGAPRVRRVAVRSFHPIRGGRIRSEGYARGVPPRRERDREDRCRSGTGGAAAVERSSDRARDDDPERCARLRCRRKRGGEDGAVGVMAPRSGNEWSRRAPCAACARGRDASASGRCAVGRRIWPSEYQRRRRRAQAGSRAAIAVDP